MARHPLGGLKRLLTVVPSREAWRTTAIGTAFLLAAGAGTVAIVRPDAVVSGFQGATGQAACTPTSVAIAVAPELITVLQTALQPLEGRSLPGNRCLTVDLRSQTPVETLMSMKVLPADRLPQLWIPDSSLWLARIPKGPTVVASLATSPLIVATSKPAMSALGWTTNAPSWAEAMRGVRPVAVPDLATSAAGLEAALALRTSMGGGIDADRAMVAAVLAAKRAEMPTAEQAFAAAQAGQVDAPLVPASEQQVFVAKRSVTAPSIVSVYPRDGSPSLDYPIVMLGTARAGTDVQDGVGSVIAALRSSTTRTALLDEGFRDAGGNLGETAPVRVLKLPAASVIQAVVARLQALSLPMRMLTLLDISTSMRKPVGANGTRITLVRDAAKVALGLLPDNNAIGAWVFAAKLSPTTGFAPVADVRLLGNKEGDITHRQALIRTLDALPNSLHAGGTSLYASTLAALQTMVKTYDAGSSNDVVVMTDGTNMDPKGITLAQFVAAVKKFDTRARPVRLVAIGIGPEADQNALRTMVAATPNGKAYQAASPAELQAVLFDGISTGRQTGVVPTP